MYIPTMPKTVFQPIFNSRSYGSHNGVDVLYDGLGTGRPYERLEIVRRTRDIPPNRTSADLKLMIILAMVLVVILVVDLEIILVSVLGAGPASGATFPIFLLIYSKIDIIRLT